MGVMSWFVDGKESIGNVAGLTVFRAASLPRRAWLVGVLVVLWMCCSVGLAQSRFNAGTYYQQCLRFEAGGDLETARQSCLNALELNANLTDAALTLARIDTALGNFSAAEGRLREIRDATRSAEPLLLLAEIALREGRYGEVQSFLRGAAERLNVQFNSDLDARRHFLAGQLAERQGEFREALEHYEGAVAANVLEVRYRLAAANLRLKLGNPDEAQAELEQYSRFTGDSTNPDLLSLLGRTMWARGDLAGAARVLEASFPFRSSWDQSALAEDLRALTLIHYGSGDFQSGGIWLREALRRGNLFSHLLSQSLPWLLLLLVLVALHLVGEGRVETRSGLEIVDGPDHWSVGDIYGILLLSGGIAAASALLYSYVVLGNGLAVFTPVQGGDVKALFFSTLAIVLLAGTLWRVQRNGWSPSEMLLGSSGGAFLGVGVGLVLVAGVLLTLNYAPNWDWLKGFPLQLSTLSPLVVAAVVTLPLAELFFRAFAVPSLSRRYTPVLAVLLSSTLYALVLGLSPVLMLGVGLVLGVAYRRTSSGLAVVVAQFVLHLGLVLAVTFNGWAHSLFMV
jgi:tetratricopeptide (TPR) repeat protein/membrane protease YdiL (CAAX protease family)